MPSAQEPMNVAEHQSEIQYCEGCTEWERSRVHALHARQSQPHCWQRSLKGANRLGPLVRRVKGERKHDQALRATRRSQSAAGALKILVRHGLSLSVSSSQLKSNLKQSYTLEAALTVTKVVPTRLTTSSSGSERSCPRAFPSTLQIRAVPS